MKTILDSKLENQLVDRLLFNANQSLCARSLSVGRYFILYVFNSRMITVTRANEVVGHKPKVRGTKID